MKSKRNRKLPAIIIILIIAAYIFAFGIIAVFACICLGVFPTPKSVRLRMKNQYSDDKTYSTIVGQAQIRYYSDKNIHITVKLNEVLVDNYGYYNIGNEYHYQFIASHCKIIEANGFKDLLSDLKTNEYGSTYYEVTQPVTMIVSEAIWWDGMSPFAVGLSVANKEYLSYEN